MPKACLRFLAVMLAAGAMANSLLAQQVTGWRGDGTGQYPSANIPTQWGKVSNVLAGLTCQARKPAGDKPEGASVYTGMIGQWLVLGPLKSLDATTKPIDESLVGDELKVEPDEGQKVQDAQWTVLKPDGYLVDLAGRFGKDSGGTCYTHSYLHAAEEGTVVVRSLGYKDLKVWLNGVQVFPSKNPSGKLRKGWNRILVKVVQGPQVGPYTIYPSLWNFGIQLTAVAPFETQKKNIAWATSMPSWSIASPIVVKDRLYVTSEPTDLVCLNKADGKVLWVRSNTFFDALDEKEKAADEFKDIAALAAKLKTINDAFATDTRPGQAQLDEKVKVETGIRDGLKKIDDKRFGRAFPELHGSASCTPVSDGKNVYVWFGSGVAACYDADGNRKWISLHNNPIKHHGFNSSPVLAGGKFIFYMRKMIALDAATGKLAWEMDVAKGDVLYGDHFHSTPAVFKIGADECLYVHGQIIRATDGKVLFESQAWKENASIPSPVIANGTLYEVTAGGRVLRGKLPTDEKDIKLANDGKIAFFGKGGGDAYTRTFVGASPLVHEGLLYIVDTMGMLKVYDAATQELAYQKDLGLGLEVGSKVHPMGIAYGSPILAGKYLYFFGLHGVTVVIEPGRQYKEIARNKIEDLTGANQWFEKLEGFPGCPAVDGQSLYLRGDGYVYCIR
jgi:outer membrane protein assembly factor BamB